jgi:hypothetical protein
MSLYCEVLKLAKVAERDLSVRSGFEEITRFLGHYLEQLTTEHNSTTERFVQVYLRASNAQESLSLFLVGRFMIVNS